jgi:hypothetical protein
MQHDSTGKRSSCAPNQKPPTTKSDKSRLLVGVFRRFWLKVPVEWRPSFLVILSHRRLQDTQTIVDSLKKARITAARFTANCGAGFT